VVNSGNNNVRVFDRNFTLVRTFGGTGNGNGQFNSPVGAAISPAGPNAGRVYVTDNINANTQVFTPTGAYRSQLPGPFMGPQGIAIDSTGNSYVADPVLQRVQIFTPTNSFAGSIQTAAAPQMQSPMGVARISATGKIYVTDSVVNGRIFVFTGTTNTFSGLIGSGQLRSPTGVAINPAGSSAGNIYAVDTGNNRVRIFNNAGTLVDTFGSVGDGSGQFISPQYIALQNSTGHVYVSDAGNNRIQVFYDPTIKTGSGPTVLPAITVNTPLVLNSPLIVTGNSTLDAGGRVVINPGGSFRTGTLTLKGGGIIANTNTRVNAPTTLTNGTFASTTGNTFTCGGAISDAPGANALPGILTIGGPGTPGTVILSGDNSFTGVTNVVGATLNLTGDLNTSASPLTLTSLPNPNPLGAEILPHVVLAPPTPASFAPPIGGKGTVTKEGPAPLTLAGNSTLEGQLNINEGTLEITGSPNGLNANVNFGPPLQQLGRPSAPKVLVFNRTNNGDAIFKKDIIGNGTVTHNNSGTLTLQGKLKYTGSTTTKGTLVLTGDTNEYTGPIIVGPPGMVNAGRNPFLLVLAPKTSTVLGSKISGRGSLVKIGNTSVKLTGNNTYQGTTLVGGGRLTLSGSPDALGGALVFGGIGNRPGVVPPTPVVVFHQNGNATFKNSIIGDVGLLIKDGQGTLALTALQSPFAGNTMVNQGTLALNSALPDSAVLVNAGATLKGNGSMKSLTLSGTASPGNSIGTLTVASDFTMQPTATYLAEVSANGTSDLITAGGRAQLNGTLNVVNEDSRTNLKNKTYTILTATQGVFGRFANLISTDRIKYTVSYLANSVKIVVSAIQDLADAFSPNDNSNAARTARYLDTFVDNAPAGSDLAQVTSVLDGFLSTGNTPALKNALNQIHPSLFREFGFLSFNQATLMNKTVRMQQQYRREGVWYQSIEGVPEARLAAFQNLVDNQSMKGFFDQNKMASSTGKPKKKGLAFIQDEGIPRGTPVAQRIRNKYTSVWIEPLGQVNSKGHNSHGGINNGNIGLKSHTAGFSMGGDVQICKNAFIGLLGGYSNTPFEWKMHRGKGQMNTYNLGAYGTWIDGGFYIDGQIIGGQNRFRSFRNIAFGSIKRTAREHHRAFQLSTDAEIGYAIPLESLTFQPFFNLDYVLVHEKGYKERGAQSLNLAVKSKTAQFLQGELGATIYHTYVICDTLFRPAFQLGWLQKRPVSNSKERGGLVGQPQTLTVLGDNRVRNQLAPALSLTAQFPEGFNVTANVSAEVLGGQNTGEALLKIGYDF
jgi:autotransporter-associated beta strand protein